jgi:hypothetical protein
MRDILLAALLISATPVLATTMAGPFNARDQAAIYAAAGYPTKAGKMVGCNDGNPDWPASDFSIEPVDLGGDAKMEAFVNEGSTTCYGNTGNAFVVVARDDAGNWHKIGHAVGMPVALKTRHNGWLDVEVGGPGMGKMPVIRWTGKAYN